MLRSRILNPKYRAHRPVLARGTRAVWRAGQEEGGTSPGLATERAPCGGDVMAEECVGTVGVGRDGVGRKAL